VASALRVEEQHDRILVPHVQALQSATRAGRCTEVCVSVKEQPAGCPILATNARIVCRPHVPTGTSRA
jgi:hypothetical protein